MCLFLLVGNLYYFSHHFYLIGVSMLASRVDSKRRIRIPKKVFEAMGIRVGDIVRWVLVGERVAAVIAEKEEEENEVLSFLENLPSKKIERTGEPDYKEASKSELWLEEET